MAEPVAREALTKTAADLRLSRPVLAVVLAGAAFGLTWWLTGEAAWGGVAALVVAVLAFVPLFAWNYVAISNRRLAAAAMDRERQSDVQVFQRLGSQRRGADMSA